MRRLTSGVASVFAGRCRHPFINGFDDIAERVLEHGAAGHAIQLAILQNSGLPSSYGQAKLAGYALRNLLAKYEREMAILGLPACRRRTSI